MFIIELHLHMYTSTEIWIGAYIEDIGRVSVQATALPIQLTQYFQALQITLYACNYMYNVLWAECIAHKQ